MWYENVDNTKFLNMIYDQPPALEKIIINSFELDYMKSNVLLNLVLPISPKHLPVKWQKCGYNNAILDINFIAITDIDIKVHHEIKTCSIDILNHKNNRFRIDMQGKYEGYFISEANYIQNINGINI